MVREGFREGMERYDFSIVSIFRGIILVFLPMIVFGIGLLPCLFSAYYLYPYFSFSPPYHIVLFAFFLVFEFYLFMIFETIIPGLFLLILRPKNSDEIIELSIKDKRFFRLAVYNMLFRPPLKLIEQFKILPLRVLFYKMAGLKIGKTSIIPGTELFYDPYTLTIGENTLFGGSVKITGHMVDKNQMRIKKVEIGDNCMIGAETFIMAGAKIEDNVTVGIRSLVVKNQVLKKGKTYVGSPAKEI